MFSIYMNNDNKTNSSIMFGSWNKNILKDGDSLHMIKTVNGGKWNVYLKDLEFMKEKISVEQLMNPNPTILFEPSVPYIQIPQDDWIIWYAKINDRI